MGKSTLFKALTKKEVNISNYPFCTIDPNVGIVKVPDERLARLADFSKSEKIVPTAIEFVDIAGLVKDAHRGEGLGNKFLANIREVDMIVHIVRGFEDENIIHVGNKVDPKGDIETINIELILADLETVNKMLSRVERDVKSGDKAAAIQKNLIAKFKDALENGKMANTVQIEETEKEAAKSISLLTNKPVLFVVNVNESQKIDKDTFLPNIKNKVFLPIKFELDLAELAEPEAIEFRKETNMDKSISSLDELITKCYDLLGLITFLTTGEDETRAWTIKKDSTAPQAGRAIHTDFEQKFIRASVINWQKLIEAGSWAGAVEKALLRTEGKEYIVQDGDVIEFKI